MLYTQKERSLCIQQENTNFFTLTHSLIDLVFEKRQQLSGFFMLLILFLLLEWFNCSFCCWTCFWSLSFRDEKRGSCGCLCLILFSHSKDVTGNWGRRGRWREEELSDVYDSSFFPLLCSWLDPRQNSKGNACLLLLICLILCNACDMRSVSEERMTWRERKVDR